MERADIVANDNRLLQTAFFLCVISAIGGSLLASDRHGAWQWLHYLTKPTATALLIKYGISKCLNENLRAGDRRWFGVRVCGGLFPHAPGRSFFSGDSSAFC